MPGRILPGRILPGRIKDLARAVGFDLCGIAPVRDFDELRVFPRWIAEGKHGDMAYMAARNSQGDDQSNDRSNDRGDDQGQLRRASLRRVAPWARSLVVCAINYNTAYPYSTETTDATRGWISRYAWSREDYHDAVLRRLRAMEEQLPAIVGDAGGLQVRSYVDTGPLIERVYAKHAGIGWIGKNTCIINQKIGSWLFLGVILTSLELAADVPAPDRCGSCTRCIVACPTQAITAPGELDARLCISYLTIEKRGAIPEDLRAGMGRHVFGCDICQDVCPWNRKAPATEAVEFEPREGLVNPSLEGLAKMPADEFRLRFRGSPIRRAKLSGLRRNAVVAMGNSGDRKFIATLRRLSEDGDANVAEHASWALRQLENRSRD